MLSDPAARDRLVHFLAAAAGARTVAIGAVRFLAGGAVQEHWLLQLALRGGPFGCARCWVLRADGATPLGIGLTRAQEFAVLRVVYGEGLTVPEPLFLCTDAAISGRPFFLMRWLPGIAAGEAVVAQASAHGAAWAEQLGRELARLHAIRPPRADLACLAAPPADTAAARMAEYRRHLDGDGEPHPVAEWGLRWLMRNKPPPLSPVLCHGDFRTGNYLVDGQRLAGILDWEFAGWGDPDEDIGWFCSRCWRFGQPAREAGGLAGRAAFYSGYQAVSGRRIDPDRVRYWEAMAALRWLVIALKQRDRFLRQGERSLDLALTGKRVAECEMAILLLTDSAEKAP